MKDYSRNENQLRDARSWFRNFSSIWKWTEDINMYSDVGGKNIKISAKHFQMGENCPNGPTDTLLKLHYLFILVSTITFLFFKIKIFLINQWLMFKI